MFGFVLCQLKILLPIFPLVSKMSIARWAMWSPRASRLLSDLLRQRNIHKTETVWKSRLAEKQAIESYSSSICSPGGGYAGTVLINPSFCGDHLQNEKLLIYCILKQNHGPAITACRLLVVQMMGKR